MKRTICREYNSGNEIDLEMIDCCTLSIITGEARKLTTKLNNFVDALNKSLRGQELLEHEKVALHETYVAEIYDILGEILHYMPDCD